MFIEAISKAIKYTKPLLTGRLFYKDFRIENAIGSLIVLNKDGDILTCGHVADLFMIADDINEVFYPILKELKDKKPKEIARLEKKYGINDQTLIAVHNIIVDIVNNPGRLNIIKHPFLDLAIIKVENHEQILVKEYPIFRKEDPLIGEQLCKLGFAFPEYDTFYYDPEQNLVRTSNNIMNFPLFPLDGMVTRNVVDANNEVSMFEMSSPCLPGQSGGPIFDQRGYVCGIQAGTRRLNGHYHENMPFSIDLGIGINVKTITTFLDHHQIKYNKAPKK